MVKKKFLFSTNLVAKLLSDSLLSFVKSINHNLGYNHLRNSVQTPKLGLFANCKFSRSFITYSYSSFQENSNFYV